MTDIGDKNNIEFNVPDQTGEYKTYRDFTTLDCWKLARKVKLFFYKKVIPRLPIEEKYNLGSQIRNASISSTANIAEGYGRFHYKESIQFYRISRGSQFELKDHLINCLDLKYISDSLFDEGRALLESSIKMLNGYIGYVQRLSGN
ncbi:MAG: four helix bundle protein [Candidatus Hodarchaeota archaeon]